MLVAVKRPSGILIMFLVSIDVVASSWPIIAISDGGRPCTGPRRLRDTVRVPFVYMRRMRSVSIFESHVSASRPHHALAIRQHEGNPRAQTRVALRVQGGPWPVWPQPLGPGLTLPSIEAAGAQPLEHPGRQFTHTGASRSLTPFSADAVTEPDPLAPGFGPRGHGVATGVAQGDRTRDGQRLAAAPRPCAGTWADIRGPVRSGPPGRSEQGISEDAWVLHGFRPAGVSLLPDQLRKSPQCPDYHRRDRTQWAAFG